MLVHQTLRRESVKGRTLYPAAPLLETLLGVLCVCVVLLPSLNYGQLGNPLASDAFDGRRYVIGQQGVVQQGSTGASVLATLAQRWGYPVAMSASSTEPFPDEFEYSARDYGFAGRWVRADKTSLYELPAPFVVRIAERGKRPHYILINEGRNGYVYATDPQVGNVLYPLKGFLQVWQKQAFVLGARQ